MSKPAMCRPPIPTPCRNQPEQCHGIHKAWALVKAKHLIWPPVDEIPVRLRSKPYPVDKISDSPMPWPSPSDESDGEEASPHKEFDPTEIDRIDVEEIMHLKGE